MIGFLLKLSALLLRNKTVENNDIAASYDKVSKRYDQYFLDIMHKHNDKVLDLLTKEIRNRKEIDGDYRPQILDLACGTGYNSRYLQSKGIDADYTLVDLSKGMLHIAKENSLNSSKVTYVNQDMLSFLKGYSKESFDVIICMWAIKYQPPKRVIGECERVLKKEGLMSVIVNTADTLPQMRRLYPKLILNNWRDIKMQMVSYFNKKNILKAEHRYVFGLFEKGRLL